MLEAIGSHHKSKQTNTLCDISISEKCTLVQKHTSCISFAKHSNPSGELNTRTFATTNEQDTVHIWIFFFLFFIQWFYVHFQLLCLISLVYLLPYTEHNIVIVIVFPVCCRFFFVLFFINYPFKHKISYNTESSLKCR